MECFVCLQEATTTERLLRVCACETRVHPRCLRRLVRDVPAHRAGCPICLQPYPVATTTCVGCVVTPGTRSVVVVHVFAWVVVVGYGALAVCIAYYAPVAAVMITTVLLVLVFMHTDLYRMRGVMCCCAVGRVRLDVRVAPAADQDVL